MTNKITRRAAATLAVVIVAFVLGGSALSQSLAGPTITSTSAKTVRIGASVTLYGTDLAGATVTFKKAGQQPVTATQLETLINPSGTSIRLTIPDGSDAANGFTAPPGNDTLVIATTSGTTTSSLRILGLRKVGVKPLITGVSPGNGVPGRTITITGSHLSGATGVWLSGTKATFKVPSDTKILAVVPKSATSGRWSVRTAVGTSSSPVHFTVAVPAN